MNDCKNGKGIDACAIVRLEKKVDLNRLLILLICMNIGVDLVGLVL